MTVCARYWNEGPGNSTLETFTPVWPSKEACCQAGGGAYEKGEAMSHLTVGIEGCQDAPCRHPCSTCWHSQVKLTVADNTRPALHGRLLRNGHSPVSRRS